MHILTGTAYSLYRVSRLYVNFHAGTEEFALDFWLNLNSKTNKSHPNTLILEHVLFRLGSERL